jgi:hypothetical protein
MADMNQTDLEERFERIEDRLQEVEIAVGEAKSAALEARSLSRAATERALRAYSVATGTEPLEDAVMLGFSSSPGPLRGQMRDTTKVPGPDPSSPLGQWTGNKQDEQISVGFTPDFASGTWKPIEEDDTDPIATVEELHEAAGRHDMVALDRAVYADTIATLSTVRDALDMLVGALKPKP